MNIALLLFLHLGAAGTDATHGIELVFPHFRGGGLESSVLRGVLRTGMKKGMATRSRILAWRIPRLPVTSLQWLQDPHWVPKQAVVPSLIPAR